MSAWTNQILKQQKHLQDIYILFVWNSSITEKSKLCYKKYSLKAPRKGVCCRRYTRYPICHQNDRSIQFKPSDLNYSVYSAQAANNLQCLKTLTDKSYSATIIAGTNGSSLLKVNIYIISRYAFRWLLFPPAVQLYTTLSRLREVRKGRTKSKSDATLII